MKQLILFACLSILAFSCVTTPITKPLVGISFPEFSSGRWRLENEIFISKFKSAGIEVITTAANRDATLQNTQIRNMAAAGAQVIIIIPFDGKLVANTVDEITKQGIKVIAYDMLIQSAHLTAFVGFDNVEVGRNQVRGILELKNKGNFVLLNGSPSDYNASLLRG